MVKQITKFVSEDGKEFGTAKEAESHENKVKAQKTSLFDTYCKTSYGGKRLLEKHSLAEDGVWQVRGEDPNPDMVGHHSNPYIGTYQGTLEEVIKIAVMEDKFWTWGSGGDINKISVVKV